MEDSEGSVLNRKSQECYKERALNLFRFLKEASDLRIRPIYDIEKSSGAKVVWFKDIPNEKECTTFLKGEDSHDTPWVKIQKPKIKNFPKPPKDLLEWMDQESLKNDPDSTPELKSQRWSQNGSYPEDYEKIREKFLSYLNHQWNPWAEERKRIDPILKVYKELYAMYNEHKNKGEVYQVVLALGLLVSNDQTPTIRRHIVTTPLSFNFEQSTGTITIQAAELGVNFSLEMDMLERRVRPDNSEEIKQKLEDIGDDFWKSREFKECLHSWINRYNPEGQYEDEEGVSNWNEDFPVLSFSPAIILRKRTGRSLSTFFKKVIKNIEESNNSINPCLAYILDKSYEKPKDTESEYEEKYYFPLTSNNEQKEVVKNISNNLGIVLKGPPGTGKTQSIANLICHLLSNGKRILVTSQTDRALKVLKNKLPDGVKDLCVEILGQDQKSISEMKKSILSINDESQKWNTEKDQESQKVIHTLEKDCEDLNSEKKIIEEKIANIKKSETVKYDNIFGGYSGFISEIVEQILSEKDRYEWIDKEFEKIYKNPSPLFKNDKALYLLKFLTKIKDCTNEDLTICVEYLDKILSAKQFEEKVTKIREAKQTLSNTNLEEKTQCSSYINLSSEDFELMKSLLSKINKKSKKLKDDKRDWVNRALEDCIKDKDRVWKNLLERTQDKLKKYKKLSLQIDQIHIENFPKNVDLIQLNRLVQDYRNLMSEKGRFIKFNRPSVFYCQLIKKLKRYLQDVVISGRAFKEIEYDDFCKLEVYLQAKIILKQIKNLWKDIQPLEGGSFSDLYHECGDLCEPLSDCLSIHSEIQKANEVISQYDNIYDLSWDLESTKKELEIFYFLEAQKIKTENQSILEKNRSHLRDFFEKGGSRVQYLINALKNEDIDLYKKVMGELLEIKEIQEEYKSLVLPLRGRIEYVQGSLYKNIRKNPEDPSWREKLSQFEKAWHWSCANSWLSQKCDSEKLNKHIQEKNDIVKNFHKKIEKLVAMKSWGHCLKRMTDEQCSSLKGLYQAIHKIGKGTGVSAAKHRKVAQKKMVECREVIPAWIMPIYRVVENVNPGIEPFDVVIIDEASQTSFDGFLLHYIAKKIIVVGDEEQISPEMVGIREDDIENLKEKYITDHAYSEHIGREYSYYEYCDIRFNNRIQLIEHFRCMPEIIAFSNKHSYANKPLIPMRQFGRDRLKPLRNTFVQDGVCEGGSSNSLINRKEAQKLLEELKRCVEDPRYKGKTFGVICLQGKSQARLIESHLEEYLSGETIEDRDIVVGDPYDFQGDERNVIFMSMIISKDYNFTALTKDSYKKRYNVGASRAKDQVWLFHSVDSEDLNPRCFRQKLLDHCKNYKDEFEPVPKKEIEKLGQQIKNTSDKNFRNVPDPFNNWFESEVFYEVARKGYLVKPHYEVSNYRMDIVVIGKNGKLVIECDSKNSKERNYENQWDLERVGWNFLRICSSAFLYNKEKALSDIWETLGKMEIYPQEHEKPVSENKMTINNVENGVFFKSSRAVPSKSKMWDVQSLEELLKNTKDKEFEKPPKPFDSWFEVEVFCAIKNQGYKDVQPQYPSKGFRIDIAVLGDGGKKMAVECDGDYFHGDDRKEYDENRQGVLEEVDWVFSRVLYSDFKINPNLALENLWKRLGKIGIYPAPDPFLKHIS